MERLSFNHSTKNIPVTPKSEYIRQLIDKTEQFLCRMRWKAYHFINPNQKSGKDTFGFKTRNNPPVIEELKEFEDGMTKPRGGGGVLPNMGHIGMCGPKG